jgi:ADP-ribose pyrophosphatase YjhB (NUDIX family)
MVAFDKETALFNYRVAGVAIHDSHILLVRNSRNSYWVFPGGHPELMEPMTDALIREIHEELGEEVGIIRLIWILENFFHKKKDVHELSFYFLLQIPTESRLLKGNGPFYGEEHGNQLTFQWFPIDELQLFDLPLYPSYLAGALTKLPNSPQHIVFKDPGRSKNLKDASPAKVDNFLTFP